MAELTDLRAQQRALVLDKMGHDTALAGVVQELKALQEAHTAATRQLAAARAALTALEDSSAEVPHRTAPHTTASRVSMRLTSFFPPWWAGGGGVEGRVGRGAQGGLGARAGPGRGTGRSACRQTPVRLFYIAVSVPLLPVAHCRISRNPLTRRHAHESALLSTQLADLQRGSETRVAALEAEAADWRTKHAAAAAAAADAHVASEGRVRALQAELAAAQEEGSQGRREGEGLRRSLEEATAGQAAATAEAARWRGLCQEAKQAGAERAQALEERVRALQEALNDCQERLHAETARAAGADKQLARVAAQAQGDAAALAAATDALQDAEAKLQTALRKVFPYST